MAKRSIGDSASNSMVCPTAVPDANAAAKRNRITLYVDILDASDVVLGPGLTGAQLGYCRCRILVKPILLQPFLKRVGVDLNDCFLSQVLQRHREWKMLSQFAHDHFASFIQIRRL